MRPYHRLPVNRGLVTGYVFKLVRESIPSSQERLATALGVDPATVQSWESGRRPYTSVSLRQAVANRHKLATLGADQRLLSMLDLAPEADHMVEAVLAAGASARAVDEHPLGWTVLTHPLTELLAWAVVGEAPAGLEHMHRPAHRRGPVASSPQLGPADREAFFTGLRRLAEHADPSRGRHVLLHRQACFLAGLDPSGVTATWLHQATAGTVPVTSFPDWSPLWPDARSVATSLARQGDPQPLRDFIARAHPTDNCELAGLNYSAYWVGEVGHRQRDDVFMVDRALAWRGGRLLRHLTERLHADHAFIDLNIHTLWALLAARRDLALDDPDLGQDLLRRTELTLEQADLSAQSRRELTSISYGLRMNGHTSEGNDNDQH